MAVESPGTRLVADITLVAKRRVKYPPRATDTKVKSCFNIHPISKTLTPKRNDPWRRDPMAFMGIFEQPHNQWFTLEKQWKTYMIILFFQQSVDSFHHSPRANCVYHTCVSKEPKVLNVHCKRFLSVNVSAIECILKQWDNIARRGDFDSFIPATITMF